MQAAETVYEFGSSIDEDDDNDRPSTSKKKSTSASDDHLAIDNDRSKLSIGQSSLGVGCLINTSNTSSISCSSATNSSRGNVSQSGILHQQSSSHQQQNPNFDSNVISERVKNLATQIYQELKRIISRCYDEDILSGLMPLIVRVLESLDLALIENQQLQVELELCKDDNEQLVLMFEKEKAAKRATDKKVIESEYAYEEERQQYQQKINSLDNALKMYELKAKNASDQASRFEEKEAERKNDYNRLHDRYTELLKSHCDVVERVRHLLGNSEVANLHSIQHMAASSPEFMTTDLHGSYSLSKTKSKNDVDFNESGASVVAPTHETLKSWSAETELTLEDASLIVIEEQNTTGDRSSHNESGRVASDPGAEHEKESENDSIAYTSMEKEFRKLIQENKDLLNTKNALNVVKDDLIAEVDRLTNEVSMYEQAVEQLNLTKDQMKQRISTLDAELRKTKEELEKAKHKVRENNEEGVPYSQRKRFGRAEMAKVLMERNNYKERFMELQDAVRYTELVRAKVETEKRSGLWKFFSNLFGAPLREPLAIGPGSGQIRNSSPVVSYHGSPAGAASASPTDQQAGASFNVGSDALQSAVVRGGSIRPGNRLSGNSNSIVLMDSDLYIDRSRALREGVGGRLSSSSGSGYIHAYGWSLPASFAKTSSSDSLVGNTLSRLNSTLLYSELGDKIQGSSQADANVKISTPKVPIPQFCRPLTGDFMGMKIWCATTIDLSGGDTVAVQQQKKDNRVGTSHQSDYSTRDPESSESMVNISTSTPKKNTSNQQALRDFEKEVERTRGEYNSGTSSNKDQVLEQPILRATSESVLSALPLADDSEELSTCVWICSTQHSRSKITIIDIKTKPNEMLDSFYVPTFIYCIRSIPGTKSGDLLGLPSISELERKSVTLDMIRELITNQKQEFYRLIETGVEKRQAYKSSVKPSSVDEKLSSEEQLKNTEDDADAEITKILDNNTSVGMAFLQKLNDFVAHTQPQSSDADEDQHCTQPDRSAANQSGSSMDTPRDAAYYQPISTCLPTVWMGGKDSVLYIHSAIGQWKDCIAYVKLRDSILQICHFRGKVFVALANGTLCVFYRNVESKQWEFSQYLLLDINLMSEVTKDAIEIPQDTLIDSKIFSPNKPTQAAGPTTDFGQSPSSSEPNDHQDDQQQVKTDESKTQVPKSRCKVAGIRCLEIANKNLWIGYKNRVLILDPITLRLKHAFNVVPQVDNQVRQLISMRDGVFCCMRSDLTLRLYSSLKPYQHIQNIDIEPVVSRLISPKTFVISHITAMKVVDNVLWIGNAHGIILTIPCKLVSQISEASSSSSRPGEFEESPSDLSIARFVPKCDITDAQISFHGHKDAVKFFISAHDLMLSGGQGYLDFRLDMDDQSKSISDRSHIILWQLPK